MKKYNGKLILFLVFVVIVASPILLAYYMWGYTIGVQSINGGNFTESMENEGSGNVYDIPGVGLPEKAFEEGYIDGIVVITPEVSEISISRLNITPNTVVKVKLYIKYIARRDPAPRTLEIVFNLNKTSTLIPSKDGYIRLEDFIQVEPTTVYVSENETAIAYLYINFTKRLIEALTYNQIMFGRSELPSIQAYAYITANKLIEKPYKYIWITWQPEGIKVKS